MCQYCKSENSLTYVWVFAEIKFIRMLSCRFCGSLTDAQVLANRRNFAKVKEAVERHLLYQIGRIKYR